MKVKEHYPIAPPRYTHDCPTCRYLGRYNDFDLYFCPQNSLSPTVIARFSSKGPDYFSGLEFAHKGTALYEAKRIAKSIGLL